MAVNWLVVEVEEGASEGVVRLLSTAAAAQSHIATRLKGGVAVEHIQLFAASSTRFGVDYDPIVTIEVDDKKPAKAPAAATEAAKGDKPGDDEDGDDDSKPGTQNGIRFSSMFKSS
jgi:hypothetical protein